VPALMGGDANVRMVHHAATWFFVIFTMVHIHLAIYHDYVEGRGEISSMMSGSRFADED
jgi:Ni/Fe-hydrogenase 1 B-type cytochrome subunit